jgi:hypothetical protein
MIKVILKALEKNKEKKPRKIQKKRKIKLIQIMINNIKKSFNKYKIK